MIARHSCGAQWVQVQSRTSHCAGLDCHRTFANEPVFEAHRIDGKCLDPATLLSKDGTPRFKTKTDRVGCEVWQSSAVMSEAARAHFAALKVKRADARAAAKAAS
jgi:hypothetical protein